MQKTWTLSFYLLIYVFICLFVWLFFVCNTWNCLKGYTCVEVHFNALLSAKPFWNQYMLVVWEQTQFHYRSEDLRSCFLLVNLNPVLGQSSPAWDLNSQPSSTQSQLLSYCCPSILVQAPQYQISVACFYPRGKCEDKMSCPHNGLRLQEIICAWNRVSILACAG